MADQNTSPTQVYCVWCTQTVGLSRQFCSISFHFGFRNMEISMDGRRRALDNVFIERLWRSVKYEAIYLNGYDSGADCHKGLTSYFTF